MSRLIMHIDMDAFYAAIETRDDPSLRGKALIIGAKPGSRGVVSTCSYEARKFGVHSAMPIARAYKICPHGIYMHPNIAKYIAESKKIMAALQDISPIVEPVSVDEAYVDITGLERLFGAPQKIGARARATIKETTGLTASVGIGPNRLIAKIASDHQKPDGLTVVDEKDVLSFLAPLDVSVLRGVGKKMLAALQNLGICTVMDLRRRSREELVKRFGARAGENLFNQARGIGSDLVGHDVGRKSISKETTFGEDVRDVEVLRETLLGLSCGVGRLARREKLAGRTVTVKVRLRSFETHTRQRALSAPTNADKTIFQTAWELFESSGYLGKTIRLIGVGICDWGDCVDEQLDLFERNDEKNDKLYQAMDKITEKYGRGAIGVGAAIKRTKKNAED